MISNYTVNQSVEEKRKPISRGDAALSSFVGLQHREKIKQIYAQTDQILLDTLNQGSILVRTTQIEDNFDEDKMRADFRNGNDYLREDNVSIFEQLKV